MQIFVKTLTGKTITLDVLAVSPLMIEIFDSIVSHSFGAHWKHQQGLQPVRLFDELADACIIYPI